MVNLARRPGLAHNAAGGPRTPNDPAAPLLTRRRVIASLGVLAVGALVAGELERNGGPGSQPPSAPPNPGATAPNAYADVSPNPATATAAKPSPSASPGARRAFRTRPDIAAPLIEVTTLAGIPSPGLIFLTPANGDGHDGPTIVDAAGQLVWMRPDTSGNATDLRVATLDGAPVLTWWEGANNAGIGVGQYVVVDASYRELARISGQSGRQADLHELLLTNRRTALFFADAGVGPGPLPASSGVQPMVMDCAIQEVDIATGALRFEWHAVDHVGVDESVAAAPTASNAVYDYFHGNSIEEDRDGTLIVSARNTSAVYKIDRQTGRVIWRLGGKRSDFVMGPGTTFALQHDARRQADGTITIFDDGQAPGFSRGIVLDVDETAMTATLVREYLSPQRTLSTSQGNVQVLPSGNVFIGWGSVPRFSEFTAAGRLVLDAGFTASQSYRDHRYAWVGRPAEPPAVAADRNGSGLVVYASWNGATEVARWDVLVGGSTPGRQAASSPQTGFETIIGVKKLNPGETFVAVRARDAQGAVLGTSSAIAVRD
jgi:outer membrane protein assembly factor BamB